MVSENWMILPEHIDALCPELRLVVDDATSMGNPPAESWRGFGDAVRLHRPRPVLDGVPPETRALLTYTSIDDPHYWLGEIRCRRHPGWFIALPYPTGVWLDELAELSIDAV